MKKLFILMMGAGMLSACNNSNKPAADETPVTTQPAPHEPVNTEVHVQVEQPKAEPTGSEVKVNKDGVEIKARDKNGNVIEIDTRDNPK